MNLRKIERILRCADYMPARSSVAPIAGAAVALAVATMFYPTVRDFLLREEGYAIVVEDSGKRISVPSNTDVPVEFQVRNLLARAVRIEGAESNCTCYAARGLPLVIPRRGSASLTFYANARNADPGTEVVRTARLFLDAESATVCVAVRLMVTRQSTAP